MNIFSSLAARKQKEQGTKGEWSMVLNAKKDGKQKQP